MTFAMLGFSPSFFCDVKVFIQSCGIFNQYRQYSVVLIGKRANTTIKQWG
jgi:hypothetical protein